MPLQSHSPYNKDRTTYHTTFCEMPFPHTFPALASSSKKILPSVTLACSYPLIKRCFDPFWDRHGADVPALADQVYHRPVPLAHLDFIQLQADQLRSCGNHNRTAWPA